MYCNRLASSLFMMVAVWACGGADKGEDGVREVEGMSSSDPQGTAPGSTPGAQEIEAKKADGVWIFTMSAGGGRTAHFGGAASVVDNCLFVGDAIVVWRPEHVGRVEMAIAAVLAGGSIDFELGGGGIAVSEGDEIPREIASRCATDSVWFASPEVTLLD